MNITRAHRIAASLLALLMLLPCAVGCGDEEQPSTVDPRTKLVENGSSVYTVVYPKNASTAVKTAVGDFVEAIRAATGVGLPTKTDEIKRGGVYDSATPEILFGRTGYSQTEEALKTVKNGQFVIAEVGKKLIYAAPKDSDLASMVSYFKEHLLNANLTDGEGGKTLAFAPYTSPELSVEITEEPTPSVWDLQLGGAKLSEYSIVYSENDVGLMTVITEFRAEVEQRYGIRLPTYIDRLHEPSGAEILFGKTNRELSTTLYNEQAPEMMTYGVKVRGTQVQLLYGGLFSAKMGALALAQEMNKMSADGDYVMTDMATEEVALQENADLRIMTSNVLSARWGELDDSIYNVNTPPTALRVEIMASLLAHYQPDVIGLQEACEVWGEYLPPLLERVKQEYGIEYTWIHNTHNGKLNMSSMLYRSDKLELLETDAVPFSYWTGDYYIRIMVWANFRLKSDPSKVFTAINTHWELSERVEKVQKCINEEIAMINSLRETYGYPLVATGDFNSRQDTPDYFRFMEEAKLTETRVEADKVGGLINKAGGCNTVGTPRSANGGNYIDHIYTTRGFTALRYQTIIKNMAYWMTDHSPMIADIKFS